MQHGRGDIRWFQRLPRDEQAVWIAMTTPDRGARGTARGDALVQAHLEKQRKKAKGGG